MTIPRRARLTNARIRSWGTPAETTIVWDAEQPGFGVRVMATTATATFIVQRRLKSGASCKLKIGRVDDLSAEMARRRARELIQRILAGHDPAAELKAARQAERERRQAPTVAAMVRAWLDAGRARWRAATAAHYASWAEHHILPAIGRLRAADVQPADVRALYRSIVARGTPTTANQVTSTLSAAYAWAIASDDWPGITSNPCAGALGNAKAPAVKRERFPVNGELPRLLETLHNRNDLAGRFFVTLLLTGARRNELLNAEWRDIDLDAGVWVKPAHATKQAKSHRLPLNPEALAVLRDLKSASPFPGGGPFYRLSESSVRRAWAQVCTAANLTDLRVHDLRHWNASLLASVGLSLPIIGALLGHASQSTTQRYAHLVDEALRTATAKVGEVVRLADRR